MTVLKAYIHLFVQQILKTSSRFWLSKCYLGCGIFLEFLLCFTPRNFRRMSPLTPPPPHFFRDLYKIFYLFSDIVAEYVRKASLGIPLEYFFAVLYGVRDFPRNSLRDFSQSYSSDYFQWFSLFCSQSLSRKFLL